MNGPRLLHVYETSCSRFLLPGFDAKLPNWHIKALENLSRLDDAEFLRCDPLINVLKFLILGHSGTCSFQGEGFLDLGSHQKLNALNILSGDPRPVQPVRGSAL
jgi:hypothetical protein